MIAAETLRRIRKIELRTRKLVNDSLAGAYHSAFKGRGIEFDTIRPYEPGDDVRLIDWNVTARTGSPFIKQFVEERELTVILMMDASASCLFGTGTRTKRDFAAEIGSVLAYSAVHNHDKAGLLLFSNRNELYVPPRKGRNHILRLIRDLLSAKAVETGTDIGAALRMVNRSLKRRSIIFLLSDFLSPVESYAAELSLLAHRHDVIALIVTDEFETALPDLGIMNITDAETGEEVWIDTHASSWLNAFSEQASRFRQHVEAVMLRSNVDFVHLNTKVDYLPQLIRLLQKRARLRR